MRSHFSRIVVLFVLACFSLIAQAAPSCTPITIAPNTTLPAATAGSSYGPISFSASGSSATPYSYEISSGVPAGSGLTINASSGVLSGTPTQAGNFLVTVTGTDMNGCSGGRTYALDIAVGDQTITFTSAAPANAAVGGATYNVTASATSGLPVTLMIDATATSVCSIAGNTVSFNAAGSCVIDADQSGNASFNPAPRAKQTFSVGKGNQTITFTSTPPANPAIGGPTYNVTATATSTLAVTFTIDATATSVCSISGSTVSFIGSGSCVIDADQAGDANWNAALVAKQSFGVALASSTTALALTSGTNPSVYGQSLTFTATVSGSGGTPTGTVTFMEGVTTLGTGALNGSGQATLTTSTLGAGSHAITAVYGGDATFATSTSAPLSQSVNQALTTTVLLTSKSPTVYGEAVTLTATVAPIPPGAGAPTGAVTFTDTTTSTTLGTGPVNGSGQATLTTSALTTGAHAITATYGGDSNFASSSGGAGQTVNQGATTTTVGSSVNPSLYGQSVTFTATVTPNAPSFGSPTGTVTFQDGGGTIGTGSVNGAGQATFTTSALSVASHSITAIYGGDTNFLTSTSGALSQTVSQAGTTTALISSVDPSTVNQSVTFTASVSAVSPGAGLPSGTVTFTDTTTATSLGTFPLDPSAQAAVTTSTLSAGSHAITATYSGDANFTGSTGGPLTQSVTLNASTTTLASSQNPAVFGESVTLTATISGSAGTATGTVDFLDNGSPIATGVALVAGVATFTTGTLSVGAHPMTAVYSGDPTYGGSTSNVLTQTINQADTTTTVTADANPARVGQMVTFTITVAAVGPGAGTPTGTITDLSVDGTPIAPPPTLTLDGSGQATFSINTLALGSHDVTATYSGDVDFLASDNTVSPLVQQVNQASTTTTLVTSKSPTVFGEPVTFTATVAAQAPGGGTPTGTVTFKDGGSSIGTGTLAGGIATLSTSTLAVGSHSITADYAGTASYAASSTAAPTTQLVNKADTTTALASNNNPSQTGQSVTFTATVSATAPGAGIPTGTVSFTDSVSGSLGSGALNGIGQATVSTSALTGGAHTITASYGGSGSFNVSTSSGFAQNVNAPPAITSANNTTFAPGKAGQTFTVNTTGFPTNASMSITTAGPLPNNVTLVNNNNGTATLGGIPAALTQNASPYLFTITANNGIAPNANQPFTLNIVCPTINVSGAIGAQTFNTAIAPATFTQSGGNGTIVWSANPALTAAGLSINSSTGVINGTPNNTGTFSVTVTATDAGGCTGSQTVLVPVGPSAPAQAYTGVGNTQFFITGVAGAPATPAVSSATTLLNGVTPAGTTVTAASCSANGALSGVDASGHFIMTPNVSAASVTCTYTVSGDSGGTGTAATTTANLTFTLNNKVWYISHGSAGTHDGRSNTPFSDMGGGANNLDCTATAAGDFIYIFKGTASTTGACPMKASQTLIGAGATLNVPTVSPILTVAGAAGNTPTLTGTLTVANSNTVDGIDMSTATANALINTAATTGLSLHVRNLTTTTGTGVSMTTAGNTGNITIDALTVGAAPNGINLGSLGGTLTVNAGTITNTTAAAISLAGVTTANFSGTGATTISTNALAATGLVLNATALNIGIGGLTIATSGGATGVSDTGGTVTIAAGANTFSITNTNAGPGLAATSGGTLTVTGSANTISTATGTALNVANTTIGASGLNFRSISANGGSNGIILVNTGASGGLTVTGSGSAGSGGTIQNIAGADLTTNNCGAAGAAAGVGIYLNSTSSPSFSWMNFTGTFGNFGILGYSVNGFTLDNAAMTGNFGDNVNQDEDTVHFCTLTGSATISNSTISNGAESNLRVVNASGTLNRITLQSDTFGLNQNGGGGGTLIEADGGTTNVTVLDSTFQGSRGTPFDALSQTGATMDLVFGQPGHGNTIHNTHPNIVPFAQDLAVTPSGTETFDINSNHFDSASAVQAQGGVIINAALGTATASGYFRNNTIGNSGVANSGSSGNDPGLDVESNGGGALTIKIDNNQMHQWGSNGAGFYVQVGQTFGNPTNVNVTATNNTVAEPGTFAVANNAQGFQLNAGTGTGDAPSICLGFSGNTIDQAGTGAGGDVRLRQRFNSHVALPGYTGPQDGVTGAPTVNNFVAGLNSPTPTVTSISSTAGGGGFFNTPGGAACALPAFP